VTELGSPPSHPVTWVLVLKDGREYECTGQTAVVAAASIGVLLSEVSEIGRKDEKTGL
jgi:hypothetical protein